MKELLKRSYRFLKSQLRVFRFLYSALLNIGYKLDLLSVYNIPIVINNFNRVTYPLRLIDFLESCGFRNIIILDNNSTYPPLLDFYATTTHSVIRENQNHGHLAFWKSGLYQKYKWNYFVYTDSDVIPIEECPKNFINWFKTVLDSNYSLDKVGFGIKIDDLPDTFSLKQKVIEYEKRYWQSELKPNIFKANVDTTFALYKPFTSLMLNEIYTRSAVRTGFPYLIRHLPWYIDSQNLSDEEIFYLKTCNSSSTIGKQINGTEIIY